MSSLATELENDIGDASIKIGENLTDLQLDDISDLENTEINTDDDDDDDDDDLDIELDTEKDIVGETKTKKEDSEDEDEDEDDDDDDDTEQFKKLENNFNQNVLIDFHPELEQGNYHEILALCKVIRNKNNEIIDPLHTTLSWLTKFEKARVLGVRSKQLNNGAQPMIDVPPEIIKGYTIAEMELEQKKLPFIIRRPLPNGSSEYWRVSDLELMEY